eukprot:TRINITY_DN7865_c0_g1_i1.p1 TRINITY_DN7865_c0_g1~~TRINITY_DN7865_c0_g1_i1.p1  ORF type:complete len:348 (+),score=114.26 TRINITY_DN7865_c0_g1_i1:103-1146(+)
MAFIIKKKRYKFQVELTLNELTEVSFGKAILFAKVRQLEGGNFQQSSAREEVENHAVRYDTKFNFPCKMAANSNTGVLDSCKCRVSIRKEEKGGKNFRKIGFVDVDLAEYAGAGPSTQRYILQAYDLNHRLDNSLLQITLNITLREGDLVFQRPLTRNQPILLPGEEASTGPGGGLGGGDPIAGLLAASSTPPGHSSSSVSSLNTKNNLTLSDITGEDAGHTRNSSSTSNKSQTGSVGYSSQGSQPAHSRQSSEDSSHNRNLSGGSADTGIFGSMEKDKRRKKLDSGRVDAEDVINELMEDMHLHDSGSAQEGSGGLQLYLAPDGSVRFDQSSKLDSEFQPVVIDNR